MRTSEFKKYLDDQISADVFFEKIREEVANYSLLMKRKGASISLNFEEDQIITLSINNLIKIVKDIHLNQVDPSAISYICDCLTLADGVNYETEAARELVYEFADPEINGGFKSREDLKIILDRYK